MFILQNTFNRTAVVTDDGTPVFDIEFSYSTNELEKTAAVVTAQAMVDALNKHIAEEETYHDHMYEKLHMRGRHS